MAKHGRVAIDKLIAKDKAWREAHPEPAPPKKRRKRKTSQARQERRRRKYRAKYVAHINSTEWKLFRVTVFAARGRRCERCSAIEGEMHVHHLHYRNSGKERLEDVQILCERCHKAEHGR